jgi:PEP-CTERM motif
MRIVHACIFSGLALSASLLMLSPARAAGITIINNTNFGGFNFTNFNGPNAGTNAATGTNMNGISNSGTAVGFDIDNNGNLSNFTTNPLVSTNANVLSLTGTNPMAFGVNSAGTVVGTDGLGNAFTLVGGTQNNFIPLGGTSAAAFGINDKGTIVGQYTAGGVTPGFIQTGPSTFITINAPSGPNTVNAQGINNNGLVVGFYVGTDGQVHGFMANQGSAVGGMLTGTAITDPTIPPVAGEPGATFVFSQVLGINDQGIAVGYYGDSTTSQHGFLYDTHTGKYTFLDDPNVAFSNGVEVTQITGINNFGEITGFYSDANGVFHGFVAAVPEPTSVVMLGIGLVSSLIFTRRRMRRPA